MAQASSVVPARRRVEKVPVMRRPKTRHAVQTCVAAMASALVAILVSPVQSYAVPVVLGAVALLAGLSAIVLRFVEQPREVLVRRIRAEPDARVIH